MEERVLNPEQVRRHLATSLTMVQVSLNQLGEGLPGTLAESKSRQSEMNSDSKKSTVEDELNVSLEPSVAFLPTDQSEGLASESIEMVDNVVQSTVEPGRLVSDVLPPGAASGVPDSDVVGRAIRWLTVTWFSASLLYFAWQHSSFDLAGWRT